MTLVYLYQFYQPVSVVLDNYFSSRINLPMNTYDVKIFKGSTNYIDFIVRDNDRKPINLSGKTNVYATVINELTGQNVLVKNLELVSPAVGKARLVFTPADVIAWNPGYYRYSIKVVSNDGTEQFLFTDLNKSVRGVFELVEGMIPQFIPPIVVPATAFTPQSLNYDTDTEYWTGAYKGDSQLGYSYGFYSVAVYTTNFLGTFRIQASLVSEDPNANDWFDVKPIGKSNPFVFGPDNAVSGITLFDFNLRAWWLRFYYKPDQFNKGSFDQVVLKN